MLVAQLDRVTGYEPVGRGFESLQARHCGDSIQVASLKSPIIRAFFVVQMFKNRSIDLYEPAVYILGFYTESINRNFLF